MTTHTDLIKRLRSMDTYGYESQLAYAAADALEALEQQVAALTKEREELMRDYRRILIERGEQANIASAAQAREAKLLKTIIR